MLKWTLFTLWDHVATKVVVGDSPDIEEVREDYRHRAWDALEAAHFDEQHYRLRPKKRKTQDAQMRQEYFDESPHEDDGLDEFFFEKSNEEGVVEAEVYNDGEQPATTARKEEGKTNSPQRDVLTDALLDVDEAKITTLTLDASQLNGNLNLAGRDKGNQEDSEDYNSYLGYSLSHSAKMAQTLKKTFVKSFWPPPS